MNRNRVILVIILGIALAGGLFAQSGFVREGYVRSTFSFGALMLKGKGGGGGGSTEMNLALDTDFVNKYGITFGMFSSVTTGDITLIGLGFGFGYTFFTQRFCIGLKLMPTPIIGLEMTGGLDFSTTFWFVETVGITGIVDFLFFNDKVNVFYFKLGVSLKI